MHAQADAWSAQGAAPGAPPAFGEEFERALWDLVSRELGRLGAAGGGFGGALARGPVGGAAGALGGWLGARLSRLFLRRTRAARTLALAVPPERALELARAALEQVGRLERLDVPPPPGDAAGSARGTAAAPAAGEPPRVGPLVGLVRAGSLNTNPAAVAVWARPTEAGASQLELVALAFEGLVKQRTVEGALQRVCGLVESLRAPGAS
ncbi:hypothetical protein JDY09_06370 [Thermoleophilum album]|uniref:hypothetical protein n=1 Tax=Thermoleophilum album TaxID=29539 RepID=UPI00237C5EFA|nr:hypothetical protein [Thermoleophilum album]WDT93014.1 hypothetical protein JDY09_06370 [Thermoleophilum album]